jgi:hypothetical protein
MLICIFLKIQIYVIKNKFQIVLLVSKLFLNYFYASFKQWLWLLWVHVSMTAPLYRIWWCTLAQFLKNEIDYIFLVNHLIFIIQKARCVIQTIYPNGGPNNLCLVQDCIKDITCSFATNCLQVNQ